jgi:hypothetical protein
MNLEKIITLLVIGAFIVTSINSLNTLGDPITREEAIENSLNTLGDPITREEAIEISKNSELVKEGLAISRSFTIETNYRNSSMVEQLKLWHNSEVYEKVPEGHSVWEVIWWLTYQYPPGGHNVIVIVDAEMATIIHEEKGIILL